MKTMAGMFLDCDDLLDMIPKPSSMCVSKLLNGMVTTDSCNTLQLTRSREIEHNYRKRREKGMSKCDMKILEGE
jgi:hypothetical protein